MNNQGIVDENSPEVIAFRRRHTLKLLVWFGTVTFILALGAFLGGMTDLVIVVVALGLMFFAAFIPSKNTALWMYYADQATKMRKGAEGMRRIREEMEKP